MESLELDKAKEICPVACKIAEEVRKLLWWNRKLRVEPIVFQGSRYAQITSNISTTSLHDLLDADFRVSVDFARKIVQVWKEES